MMENKDHNLKLMCKILYMKMGYSTHYEIRLRTKSYINTFKVHDVSDIDVYGYLFNADLSFLSIGAECKSGETNAMDEFYKFLGISNYYSLDKAYLIKTRIHQNTRQVSGNHKFICLSEAEIRKMLLGMELDVDREIKIENAKYQRLIKALAAYKPKNEKHVDYISLDFWNKENWRNIHNLLHIISQPNQPELFSNISFEQKFVFYYTCELLSLAILKVCSEAINLNYSDFDSAFISCLYGGAEALNEKRRIHDAVNIATQQNEKFEPNWQNDLVNICSRMSQATLAASLVPRLIQDTYENSFFSNKIKVDPKVLKKYPDLTRKFTQDLMSFLTSSCRLDKSIFEDFMAL